MLTIIIVMRRILFIALLLATVNLFSCHNKGKTISPCVVYTLDSLASRYDTSAFFIKHFKDKRVIDFIEPRSKYGEAGIYTFDENNNLRFYGFLTNDSNVIDFSIQYDSQGNEVERTGSDVVNGYFRKYNSDSLKMTIFLYSINYSYKDVSIRIANVTIKCGELYKSDIFSNLIGKTITIPSFKNLQKRMTYVEGTRVNLCTQEVKHFIDSTEIPPAVR